MIVWSSSIDICRPPEAVFEFLNNIQVVQQSDNSPVLALDLITKSPLAWALGTRIQMMPFIKGEIISEITAFDPPRELEMVWTGPGMTQSDIYELATIQDSTTLNHKKCVSFPGVLRVMEPFMRIPLIPRLEERLVDIKHHLEVDDNP